MLTKNGALIIPLSVDYIAWTKTLEKMARKDLEASLNITVPKGKELWVGGSMSPLARKKDGLSRKM